MSRSRNAVFPRRYVVGLTLFFAMMIGVVVLTVNRRASAPPPLPFATNGFVSTTPPMRVSSWNPPLMTRLLWLGADVWDRLRGSHATTRWTFAASPVSGCSVQGLLNQCMEVNGTRYLMPIGVAAGVVQFGNTNALDGPHWVEAFEKALQSGNVQCWDPQTKRTGPDQLVLLRFPAQKVVVVLPARAAAEFERTNGIHLGDGKGER
jgi:hypothetical protein